MGYIFLYMLYWLFYFSKQETAYEMLISGWSSDVFSSDLLKRMDLDLMSVLNEKLRSLENEADRLMLELYRDIYSGQLDHLQMFLLKEFFEILEKAIDRCREAGVVAYQIVLKNS